MSYTWCLCVLVCVQGLGPGLGRKGGGEAVTSHGLQSSGMRSKVGALGHCVGQVRCG